MEDLRVSALIIAPSGRWRNSLCVLLQANPEIGMVCQANDYAAALQCMAETQPAIVVLDCGLPGEEPGQMLHDIKRDWPQAHCLMLAHDSMQAQRAAQSGGDAVLQVGFSGETLYTTVRSLLNLSSPHP